MKRVLKKIFFTERIDYILIYICIILFMIIMNIFLVNTNLELLMKCMFFVTLISVAVSSVILKKFRKRFDIKPTEYDVIIKNISRGSGALMLIMLIALKLFGGVLKNINIISVCSIMLSLIGIVNIFIITWIEIKKK